MADIPTSGYLGLSTDQRNQLFRRMASCALDNSHNAIKSIWIALFTGGILALVNASRDLLYCLDWAGEDTVCSISFIEERNVTPLWVPVAIIASLYVVYLMMFYRFCIGNIRLIDIQFVEYRSVLKSIEDILDKNGRAQQIEPQFREWLVQSERAFTTKVTITILTVSVALMAIFLNYPLIFAFVFLILITVNIAALYKFRDNVHPFEELEKKLFGMTGEHLMLKSQAMTFWLKNNLIHAAAMAIVITAYSILYHDKIYDWLDGSIYTDGQPIYILSAVLSLIMFSNCFFDLRRAHTFYHPRLSEVGSD